MKNRAVENEVINVYQRISPSALPIEEQEMFNRVSRRLKNIYFHRLKFPLRFFDGLKYANFGCGTGEQDIVLASWGGVGTGIDLNSVSIDRANRLKQYFGYENQLRFIESNVLDPQLPEDKYDFVLSDGVIPHVKDPERFLEKMSEYVAPGGFLLLGYLDQAGNVQRLLHGVVTRLLADDANDFAKIERVAYSLFKEHLDRCAQYGGRSVKAVINDYIINKHSYGIDTVEVISIMKGLGLSVHTGYPVNFSFINSSPSDQYDPEDLTDQAFMRVQQMAWMFAKDYSEWKFTECDRDQWLDDLDELILTSRAVGVGKILTALQGRIDSFSKEADQLIDDKMVCGMKELENFLGGLSEIIDGDANLERYSRLFRGFNGFGTCYLSFYKDPCNKGAACH